MLHHVVHEILHKVVALLPTRWVRSAGQLQFRYPLLFGPLVRMSQGLVDRDGIIQRGLGKGLQFNATGGYPGYLFGTSESEEQSLLGKLLRPGAVFYDIGANIGFYSTLAGR